MRVDFSDAAVHRLFLNICTQANEEVAAGSDQQACCQIYLHSFIKVESSGHSVRRRQLDETGRFEYEAMI